MNPEIRDTESCSNIGDFIGSLVGHTVFASMLAPEFVSFSFFEPLRPLCGVRCLGVASESSVARVVSEAEAGKASKRVLSK